MDETTYEIAEKHLEGILGVSRDVIKEQREYLEAGAHWTHASWHVMYSMAGLRALLERLDILLPEKEAARAGGLTLQKIADQAALGGEEKEARMFETIHLTVKNKRLVMARTLGPRKQGTHVDGIVRVTCKTSENFVPGMKMLAIHKEADVWELCGRTPRQRGRW